MTDPVSCMRHFFKVPLPQTAPFRLTFFPALLLLLLSLVISARGQSTAAASGLVSAQNHPVNFLHMAVDVKIDPYKGLVQGKVVHTFTPLRKQVDSIAFNAVDIDIKQAYLNGKPVHFSNNGKELTVYPDPPLVWDTIDSVRFVYRATPPKGLYFIGWDDSTGRARKQVWSQGQGYGNRYWIPLYDHQNDKMTTETTITFDDHYQVLSNGNLVSVHENRNGTKTWHYRMDHPMSSYLVMIGIGHYGIDSLKTPSGIPVHLWYYPDQKDRIGPTYRHTLEMFHFMKQETGLAYPWNSYSEIPVRDFIHGAMENTTATVFGDFYYVNSREALDQDYLNANIHELVHHWFGDYVTARAPVEGWLHESFATYYAKLFEKKIYGENHFEWMRYQEQQAALGAARKGTLPLLSLKGGYERIYKKGSAILGMLSWIYGKQAFKRVINYYLTQHPYGLVDTQDFYRAFQHVLGVSPTWFFDEWIYRGGVPTYHVTWHDSTNSGSGGNFTIIHVSQSTVDTTESHLFRMPVDLEVHYKDGKYDSTRVWVQNASTDITIPQKTGKNVSYVLFDPCSHIIKAVDFPRTLSRLEAQASSARFMIDRYDAINAMDSIAIQRKRNFLISRYHAETFPELKAEIIRQLAPDTTSETLSLMQQALRDSSVTVRLAALTSLRKIPKQLRPDIEKMLRDSSYTVIANSLVRLVQSHDGNLSKYLEETRGINGPGHMVSILWNEINLQLGNRKSLQKLVDYTSNSYAFQTRINAAQVLRQMNYLNQTFAESLLQGITTANYRLAGAFRDICRHFAMNDQKMQLMQKVLRNTKWTKLQETRLKSFFESLSKNSGND